MTEYIKEFFRRFRRLINYGITGVINTLLDYAVFAVFYDLLRFGAGVSQAAGYMTGSVCGYLLNSNITFREGKGRTRAQFVQYIGVDLALLGISSAAMDYLDGLGLNAYIVKAAMTVAIALLHYAIYKYLVFRIKKEDSEK